LLTRGVSGVIDTAAWPQVMHLAAKQLSVGIASATSTAPLITAAKAAKAKSATSRAKGPVWNRISRAERCSGSESNVHQRAARQLMDDVLVVNDARRWVCSAMHRPLMVSACAFSKPSRLLPTDGSMPASACRALLRESRQNARCRQTGSLPKCEALS